MKTPYRTTASILAAIAIVVIVEAQPPKDGVEVKADDGTTFGHLRAVPEDRTLVFTPDGGEPMLIGQCADDSIFRVPSPSEVTAAYVFHRNCGATVDFATQVAVAQGNASGTVAVFTGRPSVELKWSSDRTLTVSHSALDPEEVFVSEVEIMGISVTYVVFEKRAGSTDQDRLDFSNVNFGATGLAAGMPRELLLRLAGWSQEASGLHRNEWKNWLDEEPYGDDPSELQKIKDGFGFFDQHEAGR